MRKELFKNMLYFGSYRVLKLNDFCSFLVKWFYFISEKVRLER